ncbi:MAG: DUF4440 domain-containing protein, partial [Acidimicrobiia bacterium]
MTAVAARLDAAIAARDAEALPTLFADDGVFVEHETGAVYDREGMLFSARSFLKARNPTFHNEPLATLGNSLGLTRFQMSASGLVSGTLDMGAYEREEVVLTEVDAQGQIRRNEFFASDRLGDAIVRLYERYAELLPAGPELERAAATARSVAAMMGPYDLDHVDGYARAFAPGIESVDHRMLGTWFAHGADAALQNLRSWFDLSDDIVARVDDILALQSDALLMRVAVFGTARAGGGAFERPNLLLMVFGADGLATRWELFDVGHEAEALARFDELTTEPKTIARIENAATRRVDRFLDAWAGHDWEGIVATFAPGFRLIDRRSYAHLDLDRDQHLESLRFRFEMRSSFTTSEVLATRGHRLALTRSRFT